MPRDGHTCFGLLIVSAPDCAASAGSSCECVVSSPQGTVACLYCLQRPGCSLGGACAYLRQKLCLRYERVSAPGGIVTCSCGCLSATRHAAFHTGRCVSVRFKHVAAKHLWACPRLKCIGWMCCNERCHGLAVCGAQAHCLH